MLVKPVPPGFLVAVVLEGAKVPAEPERFASDLVAFVQEVSA